VRLAVLFLAASGAALAQTGNFQIIDGPGVGHNLIATGGIVNGPGATTGQILPPHPFHVGPNYHYHGVLNGLLDPAPDPLGTGWGRVNYAPVVPPVNLFPNGARGVMSLTQGASGPLLEQLFGGPPLREGAGAPDWEALKECLIKPDAANAAAHVPQPAAAARAAAAWKGIEMTGPGAKLR